MIQCETVKVNGGRLIADALVENGVEYLFNYPGGANVFMLKEIAKSSVKCIVNRHEQGAAMAAEGYARVSGKPGVCMATSGPGATNLITGIANAYIDSIPMVAIVGQAVTTELKRDRGCRQLGFQEIDIVSVCKPITKASIQLKSVKEIKDVINYAFELAMEGRKGPVLIDVPQDIQEQLVEPEFYESTKKPTQKEVKAKQLLNPNDIESILEMLKNSKKPALFIGGGTQYNSVAINEFVEKAQIPVVYTMMGKGVVPDTSPLCFGIPGLLGSRLANHILENADLVLAFGVRFSSFTTKMSANFIPKAKIVQVDIDSAELNKWVNVDLDIQASLVDILPVLNERVSPNLETTAEWLEFLKRKKKEIIFKEEDIYKENPLLVKVFDYMNNYSKNKDVIITTDVGQNQWWATQLFQFSKFTPNAFSFLTSAGLAAMGYGLPAAIGAHFANPKKQVICFTGDGSFQMNIQELGVVELHKLPLKIIMLNNYCLGCVRQYQEVLLNKDYTSTVDGYQAPNFEKIVKAYDLNYFKLDNANSSEKILKEFMESKGASFLEVCLDRDVYFFPGNFIPRSDVY